MTTAATPHPSHVVASLWEQATDVADFAQRAVTTLIRADIGARVGLDRAARAAAEAHGVMTAVPGPSGWSQVVPFLDRVCDGLAGVERGNLVATMPRLALSGVLSDLRDPTPRVGSLRSSKCIFDTRADLYRWLHRQTVAPATRALAERGDGIGHLLASEMDEELRADYSVYEWWNATDEPVLGDEPVPRTEQEIERTILIRNLPRRLTSPGHPVTVVDRYVLARELVAYKDRIGDLDRYSHLTMLIPVAHRLRDAARSGLAGTFDAGALADLAARLGEHRRVANLATNVDGAAGELNDLLDQIRQVASAHHPAGRSRAQGIARTAERSVDRGAGSSQDGISL